MLARGGDHLQALCGAKYSTVLLRDAITILSYRVSDKELIHNTTYTLNYSLYDLQYYKICR